jgi:hypothetical protein
MEEKNLKNMPLKNKASSDANMLHDKVGELLSCPVTLKLVSLFPFPFAPKSK